MIPAFLAGAAAGYAIAIPVGAIAILILDTGIRRGPGRALVTASRPSARPQLGCGLPGVRLRSAFSASTSR